MEEGKLVRKSDIPIAVGGKPTAENARRWLDTQIPYRNFAGLHDGLDNVVQTWVTNHRMRFRNRMSSTMERWSTNWAAANGEALWHENQDDVHIPETKKAIDSKVARVEEALLEFDPVFEVESKDGDLSRYKAQVIGSYTYRLMDIARFRELVQPAARDAELCNIAAVKVAWDHLVDWSVDRKVELRFRPDGSPYYHNERRVSERVVRSGPQYSLVDPFWFFYDLDAGCVQDCEFIGDECEMFLHEVEGKARAGFFSEKQVKLVKDKRGSPNNSVSSEGGKFTDLPDMYRQSRMIAAGPDFSWQDRAQHNATRVRCIECWGWFDFGDGWDGVVDPLGRKLTGAQRVVVTLANGICVRFQLNPFDRKFVPYAVARINRNGHEMAAPANFDHVVQLNAQYDAVHSNILRRQSLGAAPFIVTQNDTDLPDTLLGVLPGSVLRATGQWDVVKLPDIEPGSTNYFHQYYRREIEEVSGALRVFESPQGTATETERKVQEQQRMVRNSIREAGELWRQVALITYWMSGQFATQPQRFAVAGKASQLLGKSAMVTPDILQEDVDFRFLGIQSLHTFGSRQAGIRQFMNAWGPLLTQIPGVNLVALARQDFEMSVGRSNIEEVFTKAVPPWDTWPQEEENAMILSGHEVAVSEQDDDMDHIEKLLPLIEQKDLPQYIKQIATDHLIAHMAAAERKAAEEKAAAAEAAKNRAVMGQPEGEPGVDRAPTSGGMPAQQKGVTPGPTQERTVSRTGRSGNGTSQQQAMSA